MATLGAIKIPIKVISKGVGKSIGLVKKSLQSLVSLPGLGAVFGGGFAAKELLEVGDAYINLDARLTDLLGTAEDSVDAQDQLFQMSQRTGTAMLANADAYTKLSIAQKQTGLTAEENIEVLEGINKIFALSGTNAGHASIAMQQLGQALSSGRLQGDELRSIAEAAPGLMTQLAEALGVPVGKLKEMGSAGELTSERLGKAFLAISRSAELEFKEMPVTSERAFQRIINSAQRLWDNILDNTGLISFISEKLDEVALWIEQNQDRFTGWAMEAREFIIENWEIISAKGKEMIDQLIAYTKEWGPQIKQIFEEVISLAIKLLPYIKSIIEGIGVIATGGFSDKELANVGAFDTQARSPFGKKNGGGYRPKDQSGGITINNNLSNKMTSNDIARLNTEQQRQVDRS